MNRDVPIQVKEQKQTKNKNKFHRIEDVKKILKEHFLVFSDHCLWGQKVGFYE